MGGVSSWVSEAPWGFTLESVTINEGGSVRFVDCGTPTEKTRRFGLSPKAKFWRFY